MYRRTFPLSLWTHILHFNVQFAWKSRRVLEMYFGVLNDGWQFCIVNFICLDIPDYKVSCVLHSKFYISNWQFGLLIVHLHCDFGNQHYRLHVCIATSRIQIEKLHQTLTFWITKRISDSEFDLLILTLPWLHKFLQTIFLCHHHCSEYSLLGWKFSTNLLFTASKCHVAIRRQW